MIVFQEIPGWVIRQNMPEYLIITGTDSLIGHRLDNSWMKHNMAMLIPRTAQTEAYFFG